MYFKSLLLIDDDEDDREFFLEVIAENFPAMDYCIARNGQEGLDLLVKGKEQPDVIFLDLNMPLMGGFQFLKEKAGIDEFESIPVVILSTSSDVRTINEALEMGAAHFITKPDKFSQWVQKISEFLENPSERLAKA